ncbi:MAG TPA: dienelactone hydrolase family protein [Flavitalea sp.]|nr:dienelactone hydrolase family protein [Flavitalea sp.]
MKNKIAIIYVILSSLIGRVQAFQSIAACDTTTFPFTNMPEVLPGTKPLSQDPDRSVEMLDGAHKFIEQQIQESIRNRLQLWNRDFASREAYERSVEPNRKRFMKYIGVVDKIQPSNNFNVGIADKHPNMQMQKFSVNDDPDLVAETNKYRVYQVRWPVLNRVYGEGLLLQPKTKPVANIIAIPDADQLPEQLVGLLPGVAVESQFARHLAENGFQVLIPVLVDRTFLFPGKEEQQTYREWIYRQAFHVGRNIIGYEVQKVLSAIDWFKQSAKDLEIGVAGYCEGGLIAFYSAAIDNRIDAVLVSGYFSSRQLVWDEPIYRNVWGLLSEFGDAEIASLIAPRNVIIEHSVVPEFVEKTKESSDNPSQVEGWPFTGYKGTLRTPAFKDVESEYNRIDELIKPGFQSRYLIRGSNNKPVSFGSVKALERFAMALGNISVMAMGNEIPRDNRKSFGPEERQLRQVKEIEDHVQWLLRESDQERNAFFLHKVMPEFRQRNWSTKLYHPYYSPDRFIEKGKEYRKFFWEEILGKFTDTMLHPNPRTRKVYDKQRWTGYEVVLDVYKNLFASGIILIPKDIKPGEQRPVVVCQHGRNDVPQKLVEGNYPAYNDAAAKLADQGFIVYAPQNPYRGEDRYRWLTRKANTIKKTLFSFIISQHDQTLQWLGRLPFVDKNRIAFYGLSYGGETAMRVPAVLEGYCLSICAGDFGDWSRKVVDVRYPGSFMKTLEWEMPYFNMGSTFSYAEMAYLIFPRPFMVERGHHDMVQPDEWVAYEYGKVNYFYDQFNLGERTEIEFFNGGHTMRGEGTFKFLHKHLNWP